MKYVLYHIRLSIFVSQLRFGNRQLRNAVDTILYLSTEFDNKTY